MGAMLLDFTLLALFIVGITATVGVISSAIGIKVFGRGKENKHVNQSNKTQVGWKAVGGTKK
ncbi:hypothetical protein [Bacillus solimangrovi]|uniref:Uncharacterized protein n=1 Tax=Bacillus solimangrovi TaxID=1305675 RepID=A0A1E5LC17_9BACI|nr:hypothetical protein [Bacillus solimangrovi]OEH91617.1 hypothetical protein BFG57_04390 [Bacillus solimangrovi]